MNSTIKTQQCEDAKNEYANQLQKTNEWQVRRLTRRAGGARKADITVALFPPLQNKYYNHLLPTVFQNLQDLDEKRIKCIQNYMLKAIQTEKDVLPIVSQCLDGMNKCAKEIDEKNVRIQI